MKVSLHFFAFLFLYGGCSLLIGGMMYVTSGKEIKTFHPAIVVSSQNTIDSCSNKCKMGETHYTSDSYACYKTEITFYRSDIQSNCIYVDPLSSINGTMIALYSAEHYPIGSTDHRVYEKEGSTHGYDNCNYVTPHYVNLQQTEITIHNNTKWVMISGAVILCIPFLYIYGIVFTKMCGRKNSQLEKNSEQDKTEMI